MYNKDTSTVLQKNYHNNNELSKSLFTSKRVCVCAYVAMRFTKWLSALDASFEQQQ